MKQKGSGGTFGGAEKGLGRIAISLLFTSTVGWGIHDDSVVLASSADLALNKFNAVVDNESNRGVLKSAKCSVFPTPGDHSFRGIHVTYLSASFGC